MRNFRVAMDITILSIILLIVHSLMTLASCSRLVKRTVDDFDENISQEKILTQRLLDRYAKYGITGRPVNKTADVINVTLSLQLIQIVSLDEKEQVLTISVWLDYGWRDVLLQWDPAAYDNITDIRVPSNKVWIPDIRLYNFADTRLKEIRDARVVVGNKGDIQWIPQAFLKSTCSINIAYFPFDSQKCLLKFGSWTYHGGRLDINFKDNVSHFVMTDYIPSHEWEIERHYAYKNITLYQCCPESPYVSLNYTIHIRRKVAFYSIILLLPCALLSVLTMVIFWVPPESPAKLMLGMNIFVAFFVLLLLLADSTPRATSSIPIIGAYYCLNMCMITASTFLACIVANCFFRGVRRNRAPKILRTTLIEGIGYIFGVFSEDVYEQCLAYRKWNHRVMSETRLKLSTPDMKTSRVRLLDTPNGREIGQKLSTTHEILDSRAPRETLQNCRHECSECRHDALRMSMLEEVKYIREMIDKLRDKRVKRDEQDKYLVEWRTIAFVVDRVFFIGFLLVNVTSVIFIYIYI